MVVIGAIDFSAALAPIARELGYVVTIVDARERFARSPRFARAAEVVVGWPQAALAERELGPRDVVLVLTHDPKFDEPALIAALESQAGYIRALGSRRTTADRNRRLRGRGSPSSSSRASTRRVGSTSARARPATCNLGTGGGHRHTHRPARRMLRETFGTIQPRVRATRRRPVAPSVGAPSSRAARRSTCCTSCWPTDVAVVDGARAGERKVVVVEVDRV